MDVLFPRFVACSFPIPNLSPAFHLPPRCLFHTRLIKRVTAILDDQVNSIALPPISVIAFAGHAHYRTKEKTTPDILLVLEGDMIEQQRILDYRALRQLFGSSYIANPGYDQQQPNRHCSKMPARDRSFD